MKSILASVLAFGAACGANACVPALEKDGEGVINTAGGELFKEAMKSKDREVQKVVSIFLADKPQAAGLTYFGALGQDFEMLTETEKAEHIDEIFLNHVVEGRYTQDDLSEGIKDSAPSPYQLTSLAGHTLEITASTPDDKGYYNSIFVTAKGTNNSALQTFQVGGEGYACGVEILSLGRLGMVGGRAILVPSDIEGADSATASAKCSQEYAQCGGKGFDGATCCTEGLVCKSLNPFYSQCVPETWAV